MWTREWDYDLFTQTREHFDTIHFVENLQMLKCLREWMQVPFVKYGKTRTAPINDKRTLDITLNIPFYPRSWRDYIEMVFLGFNGSLNTDIGYFDSVILGRDQHRFMKLWREVVKPMHGSFWDKFQVLTGRNVVELLDIHIRKLQGLGE